MADDEAMAETQPAEFAEEGATPAAEAEAPAADADVPAADAEAPAADAEAAAADAEMALVKEVEVKRRGKPKDTNAPPKPKNAYQRITGEARGRLKAEKPELASDLKAMGLAMKAEWDKVPEAEKEILQAEYEKEMAVWRPKWAAYKQTKHYKEFFEVKQDWVDGRQRKKLVKTMGKDAPKRPKSGYMIFAGEIRERVQKEVFGAGGGMGDIGKKISEEWAAVSETNKAEYAERSSRLKVSFDTEFTEYKKNGYVQDLQGRAV